MIYFDLREKRIKNALIDMKARAQYFPILTFHSDWDGHLREHTIIIGTWVRVYRDEKWYRVFAAERCLINQFTNQQKTNEQLMNRLLMEVEIIKHFYILQNGEAKFQEIDPLQISEEQRIKQIYEYRTNY